MKEIIIHDIMKSKKTWKEEYNRIYDYFKMSIGEDNECFYTKVLLRLDDDTLVRMGLNNYLTNLMMWIPAIKLKIPITIDMIFDTSCIRSGGIKQFIDDKYVRPYRNITDLKTMNVEPAKIIEHAKCIVEDFGLIMGLSYSMYTINKIRKENKKIDKLIHSSLPDGLQPSEIEEFCNNLKKELIKEFSNTDSVFKPLLDSGAGFKDGQFLELLGLVGNKPDLEGNTLTVPINTNIGIKGLDNPGHYLLDAKGGRKALVFNKKFTGSSGYFSRKLNLLASDLRISKSHVKDCHTKEYLKFYVSNKDALSRIEGKYYKIIPEKKYLRAVKITDEHLIGKTILIRSASKCKCKDGICETCFGELSKVINDLNAGIIAGSIISSQLTQRLLS